jgi:predicted enzyme related to lactoylglutathione lyase
MDAADPEAQARYWSELLDVEVEERAGESPTGARYVVLDAQAGANVGLAFQWVPESKQAKNRLHLDVIAERGIEDVTELVERPGGSRVPGADFSEHGWRWRVMLDPEGNEFCLVPSDD